MHHNICEELTELYRKKNHDYGDSFHKSYQEYGLTMAAIRLEDKLNRFKTLARSGAEVSDESLRDTLIDLANYAILTVMELDREQKNMVYHIKCANCGFDEDVPFSDAKVGVVEADGVLMHIANCPNCGCGAELIV